MTLNQISLIIETLKKGNPDNFFINNKGLAALGALLFYPKPNQKELSDRIKKLINSEFPIDSELIFESLRRYHFSSYYTPNDIIDLQISLFKANKISPKTILEPSAGNGYYVKRLAQAYPKAKIVALEPDKLSYMILEANFKKNAQITTLNTTFEDYLHQHQKQKDKKFDLVISNVPFGSFNIKNSFHHELLSNDQKNINTFFNSKAQELTNQNGITAILTSKGFMDKINYAPIRQEVLKHNNLITALRFNNTLFKDEKTKVVSDLIIYQKNENKKTIRQNELDFINSSPIKIENHDFFINKYYLINSNHVNGDISQSFFHNSPDLTIIPNSIPLNEFIESAINETKINKIQKIALLDQPKTQPQTEKGTSLSNDPPLKTIKNTKVIPIQKDLKEPLISLNDQQHLLNLTDLYNKGFIIENRKPVLIHFNEKLSVPPKSHPLIIDFISLKEDFVLLKENSKLNRFNEAQLKENFENFDYKLNTFTFRYGNLSEQNLLLNRDPYFKILRNFSEGINLKDTTQPKIYGIEYFKEFNKNTNLQLDPQQNQDQENKLTFQDYFTTHYSNTGEINIDHLSKIFKLEPKEIYKQGLKHKLFFLNPKHENGKFTDYEPQILDLILSGNIEEKINTFQNIQLPHGLDSEPIITALKNNINQKIDLSEITFNFESPFISNTIKHQFFLDHLQEDIKIQNLSSNTNIKLNFTKNHNQIADQLYTTTIKKVQYYGYKSLLNNFVNNTIPVVIQVIRNHDGTEKRFVNKPATLQAQNKIEALKQEFKSYILNNVKYKTQTENNYYNLFLKNKNLELSENTKLLNFPKTVINHPYKHQKEAVLFGLLNQTALFDHKVGHGKTLTMGLLSDKLLNHKKSERIFLMTLKSVSQKLFSEINENLPHLNMFRLTDKNFNKKTRRKTLIYLKNNPKINLIVGEHTHLQNIPKDLKYIKNIISAKIKMIDQDLKQAKIEGLIESKQVIKGLEKRKETLEERLNSRLQIIQSKNEERTPTLSDLKIDTIFIDESHKFKNIAYTTRHNNVSGLNDSTEKFKNLDLEISIDSIHNRKGADKNIFFFTGTPLKNSVTEVYAMQRYLQPNLLKEKQIYNFDSWASIFLKQSMEIEADILGNPREHKRFRYFTNLPELSKLYNNFTHISDENNFKSLTIKTKNEFEVIDPTPNYEILKNKTLDLITKKDQKSLFGFNKYEEKKLSGAYLIGLNINRYALIDPKLISTTVPFTDDDQIKINHLVKDAAELYKKTEDNKGVILIFSDLGTYKPNSYNTYETIANKLHTLYDIPLNEIGFSQKENTQNKRNIFQDNINSGKIRIAIGSTDTLGTGTNIQKKVVAILNLDIPYSPDAFDQRRGRGERVGNVTAEKYGHLLIKSYGIKNTSDIFSFSLNKHKQIFREQIRYSTGNRIFDNSLGDITKHSYSQQQAALIGDMDAFKLKQYKSEFNTIAKQKELFILSQSSAETKIETVSVENDKLKETIIILEELQSATKPIIDQFNSNIQKLDKTQIKNEVLKFYNENQITHQYKSHKQYKSYDDLSNFLKLNIDSLLNSYEKEKHNTPLIDFVTNNHVYNLSIKKNNNAILDKPNLQFVLHYKNNFITGKKQYAFSAEKSPIHIFKLLDQLNYLIEDKKNDIKFNTKTIALNHKLINSKFDTTKESRFKELDKEIKSIKKRRKI